MTTASPARVARAASLAHAGLVVGVLIIVVVFAFLRTIAPGELGALTWPLRGVGAALLAGMVALTLGIRTRLETPGAANDLDRWWASNLPKALLLWAVAEGTAIAGAVFWYLTGDALTLVTLTGVALMLLIVQRPGAVAGH